MERLKELAAQHFGTDKCLETVPLPISGSNRKYYRIICKEDRSSTTIGVIGTVPQENRAFIRMTEHFLKAGFPVPEIYAVDSSESHYLQQDLGDTSLFSLIDSGVCDQTLLEKCVRNLAAIQCIGSIGFDFDHWCYPVSDFDRRSIMFDLNYFKYSFLKLVLADFDECRLEDEFARLAGKLLAYNGNTFMYRDFQSRNIMIYCGNPYFIDYQGGRRGPLQYDIVSFLWQARAGFSSELKKSLLGTYIDSLSEFRKTDRTAFEESTDLFVLFRTLQVLGAYGFRGLIERKSHFILSIMPALENLKEITAMDVMREFPYLRTLLEALPEAYKEKYILFPEHQKGSLGVRVCSFSYRKGIPLDDTGNGGGYVFDCRGIPNPGREPQYKSLTGLDAPVIEYLEKSELAMKFLEQVKLLTGRHIDRYLERGFTDLSIAFGCTGGQHRSVFCAQRVYEWIKENYPDIQVSLCHREQSIRL